MSSGDESEQSRRHCVLSWDQVQRLDSILGESVPIHGRRNFPTLSVQPRQIVQVRVPLLVSTICLHRNRLPHTTIGLHRNRLPHTTIGLHRNHLPCSLVYSRNRLFLGYYANEFFFFFLQSVVKCRFLSHAASCGRLLTQPLVRTFFG